MDLSSKRSLSQQDSARRLRLGLAPDLKTDTKLSRQEADGVGGNEYRPHFGALVGVLVSSTGFAWPATKAG
jgi:hypothetical protein